MLGAWDLACYCEQAGVSYHAITDGDEIVYTVPRSDRAWHLRNGNPWATGLCLTSPSRPYSRDEWLGPQVRKMQIAAWWLAVVCNDTRMDMAECSDQNIRDVLRGVRSAGGVINHADYTRAARDGTHDDIRNFPTDVCVGWARDYARSQGWPTEY